MKRMHDDKEVVSQVYIDDNTLIVEKADGSAKDYPIAPTTETLSDVLEGSDSISVDLNEAGTKLQVKVDEDVLNEIEGKLDAPSNEGSVGQVLTKTASGSEWADPESKLYVHRIKINKAGVTGDYYFEFLSKRETPYASLTAVNAYLGNRSLPLFFAQEYTFLVSAFYQNGYIIGQAWSENNKTLTYSKTTTQSGVFEDTVTPVN